MNAWELYDKVIAGVPTDDTVRECLQGTNWMCIVTERGRYGLNAVQPGTAVDPRKVVGRPLREVAALAKSWCFNEAAAGIAAINAARNQTEFFRPEGEQDAFLRYRDRLLGKKVACVGHFAYLERRLEGLCDLFVLERKPEGNDYPDTACEYLLPEMDAVFITGSAFANKTMPRLLKLCENAFTVISGPSTPMDPVLFGYGADALCGFCVTDDEKMRAALNGDGPVFACGQMVCLERKEV
ncbi:MAG: DUF364 domain-containing protein [Clostridia bacterium]|nr:DUF364 domain-containing protein [Clostridia bacterium]